MGEIRRMRPTTALRIMGLVSNSLTLLVLRCLVYLAPWWSLLCWRYPRTRCGPMMARQGRTVQGRATGDILTPYESSCRRTWSLNEVTKVAAVGGRRLTAIGRRILGMLIHRSRSTGPRFCIPQELALNTVDTASARQTVDAACSARAQH
jgi:hypothetical protein